ncbi:MAG: LysR substrate-binding domain-containing protein [Inquilinus sp.]|uniref:LysR substrate-binding domain-containing protein n=1 Tax=Inquilinus sp. TaxID=1932117 RepID=UPI003F37096D
MELRHLRYFVAVAEEGSVTRAAERLGIQQPPLGLQIRALEDELGVQLFDRQPKRLSLNAAGVVFLERARQVLGVAEEAVEHVRRFDQGERGRLTVGFTSSASLHHLTPHLLRAFRQAYPLVRLEVDESETYGLILALEQRRIDAAFLHIGTEGFAGLASTVLAQEDMVVAIPSDHPLAPAPAVTLPMLSGQDLVVYRRPDGPGMFDGIMRAFAAAGVIPRVTDVVHRLIAAINLVAAGRGLTLVPASIQVLHPQAVTYRPLAPGALPPLPLYLAYRRDAGLALVRNFIAVTGRAAAARATLPR